MTEANKKTKQKTGDLGKIILDTSCLQQVSSGGGCPVEKFIYVLFIATGLTTDLTCDLTPIIFQVSSMPPMSLTERDSQG